MEEENKNVDEEEKEKKSLGTWIKNHIAIVVIALVILIAAIVAVVLFLDISNTEKEKDKELKPEDAVEIFLERMSSGDSSKVIDSMDLKASLAWSNCNGVPENFKEEYDTIDEEYKNIEEQFSYAEQSMQYALNTMSEEYEKFNLKISEVNSVEELANNLYEVDAKIELTATDTEGEEYSNDNNATFIVYKDKVIDMWEN